MIEYEYYSLDCQVYRYLEPVVKPPVGERASHNVEFR